tara:strand:+ start:523 stop:939 length:417 start_codon:yes stop_codon:yes gene_type:complete
MGCKDRVGVVVRSHAPQQVDARRMYRKLKMRSRQTRTFFCSFIGPFVPIQPLTETDNLNIREHYLEGPCIQEYMTEHLLPSKYVLIPDIIKPSIFIEDNPLFMASLEEHHCVTRGGDGADPRVLLQQADGVVAVYSTE